jgi:Alg9-like mannosyltransferase family
VAVRFTSLAAWIPIGILLALQRPRLVERIYYLVMPCALFGLVGIGLSLIVDRYFYGFWTIPFLGSLYFNVVLGE